MEETEFTPGDTAVVHRASAPLPVRLRIALFATGAAALIAAGALLLGDGVDRPVPSGSPSATLEAALEDGTPAYVLIHSLT